MDQQPDYNTPPSYESIIRLLDDAVVVLDSGHTITYLNPSAETLLQSLDNVIGQSLTTVLQNCCQIELSLDRLPDTPIVFQVDGETHYYQLQQKPLPENNGSLVIFNDVTTQHHTLTELKRLQVSYSDFAHTLAHDVKSPLGVAIGYSNMLQADLDANTEARIFADEIFDTSMRIMYICSELTVLAELGHTTPVDLSPVNLLTSIGNSLRRFEKDMKSRNIRFNTPETIPLVSANAMWMDEVVANFVHHILENTGQPSCITFDAHTNNDMLRLRIHHDGTPLLVDEQLTLYDQDRPLDKVRAQGQGLGLDIAARLIKRLGGQVGMEDESTFYFSLPLDQ